MIRALIAEWQFAIGPLWNGYVVLLHATAFVLGTIAFVPFVRRRSPAAEAGAYAFALLGMSAVSLACWLPGIRWAAIIPRVLAEPLFWIGSTGVAAASGAVSPSLYLVAGAYVAWLLGSMIVLTRAGSAYLRLFLISKRASPCREACWRDALILATGAMGCDLAIDVRRSEEVTVPMTWGLIDRVILLPSDCVDWTDEERDLVLRHELAHVRRHDAALSFAALLTRAWYWFHPGVWWLASRLRASSERAADAMVVASGARASRYAALLVAMSDRATDASCMSGAVPLLRANGIADRVHSLLDAPQRSPLPRSHSRVLGIAGLGWMILSGGIRLAPQRQLSRTALADEDWSRRAYAVQLLSRTRAPEVRAAIARLSTSDPNPTVRRTARQFNSLSR